jgi:hypothetical protein
MFIYKLCIFINIIEQLLGQTLVVDGGDWLTAAFYQYPQILEGFPTSKL